MSIAGKTLVAALLCSAMVATAASTPIPARRVITAYREWSASSTVWQPRDFHTAAFVGNGRIGSTIPPAGQGYQDYGSGVITSFPLRQPRHTGTYLAGFYAHQGGSPRYDQLIAALPSWSDLSVTVAGYTYRPDAAPASVSDYRQEMNFHDATVTTDLTWTPDPTHALELRYRTFISRVRPNLAVQQLTVVPRFAGPLDVVAPLDGRAARRVTPLTASSDPGQRRSLVGVRAAGTNDTAFLVSRLAAPAGASIIAMTTRPDSAGLRAHAGVSAGRSYTFTKYVGIASTADGPLPDMVAAAAAEQGYRRGFVADFAEHAAAWHRLWQPTIAVPGRSDYALWIRTALYPVLASVRDGQRWSIPPAGLTSDDYGGLVFWDAETWIFPALLALYPNLARSVVQLRADTLGQARKNAAAYGFPGAIYPWDNGPDQRCVAMIECGLYEEHVENEIALAQWQYYAAGGDREWLRRSGAPVIIAIADYLVARVSPTSTDGKYHYLHVAPADEYREGVNDDAMTNVGVMSTLRLADTVATITGMPVNPRWNDVAARMAMPPDIVPGVPAEFDGYAGAKIKQADTVLLSYPFDYTAPGYSPRATMDYYFPRTDPDGPNMSNSAGAILSAQYDPCRTRYYLDRAVAPYVKGPYQFQAEARGVKAGYNTRGQAAWIFLTGSAGFLQALLYGPTGLRWTDTGAQLNPMLPSGFGRGMTVRGLVVRGRTLTIDIGADTTAVILTSGAPLSLGTPSGPRMVSAGRPLTLPTRRACG